MQLRQKSRIAWSCPHRMYLQADLSYEITQERGYCVTRLRSVELLKPPPTACVRSTPRKIRANVIPFPKPKDSTFIPMEKRDIQEAFTQLAQTQLQGSIETREQSARLRRLPDETVAAFSAVLAALSNE